MSKLPGYKEALARGQEIEAIDKNFKLDAVQDLVQETNNRVLSGAYNS